MRDLQVVAESAIHDGRRLLICSEGTGYIQLEGHTEPMPVPASEFARLRKMRHYRSVSSLRRSYSGHSSVTNDSIAARQMVY